MFLDLDPLRSSRSPWANSGPLTNWTVLIPFFNERDYLAATITSIAAQSLSPQLILIDNGSTDGSADVAREACDMHGLDFTLITEPVPGKTAALKAGLAWVRTPFVATCDADTVYPPHYLSTAQQVLERPGCAVAGSYFIAPGASEIDRLARSRTFIAGTRLMPKQCHSGGAGQAFNTATLLAAGGFDPARWDLVLEDHEIIHRVMKHGEVGYSTDLWCMPSLRDRDRASIRWTRFERAMYTVMAPVAANWFFYSFLARRLSQRQLSSSRMRERQFYHLEGCAFAPSYSVR